MAKSLVKLGWIRIPSTFDRNNQGVQQKHAIDFGKDNFSFCFHNSFVPPHNGASGVIFNDAIQFPYHYTNSRQKSS